MRSSTAAFILNTLLNPFGMAMIGSLGFHGLAAVVLSLTPEEATPQTLRIINLAPNTQPQSTAQRPTSPQPQSSGNPGAVPAVPNQGIDLSVPDLANVPRLPPLPKIPPQMPSQSFYIGQGSIGAGAPTFSRRAPRAAAPQPAAPSTPRQAPRQAPLPNPLPEVQSQQSAATQAVPQPDIKAAQAPPAAAQYGNSGAASAPAIALEQLRPTATGLYGTPQRQTTLSPQALAARQATAAKVEVFSERLETWLTAQRQTYDPALRVQRVDLNPPYPAAACRDRLRGVAIVSALFNPKGKLVTAEAKANLPNTSPKPTLLQSTAHPILDEQAIALVKDYQLDGTKKYQALYFTMNFSPSAETCPSS